MYVNLELWPEISVPGAGREEVACCLPVAVIWPDWRSRIVSFAPEAGGEGQNADIY